MIGSRIVFIKEYRRNDVEIAMGGKLDNLRSRAIFDATADNNCDAIVAATFKIELSEDGEKYNLRCEASL